MKFLFVLVLTFFLTMPAFADAGIPLILFVFPLGFISHSFSFGLGILLFFITVWVETFFLKKSEIANNFSKEELRSKIIRANLWSTFAGILLLIFSYTLIDRSMCKNIACDMSLPGSVFFPANFFLANITNIIICFLLSFYVEFQYLKKHFDSKKIKKTTFIFNLISYILLLIITALFYAIFFFITLMVKKAIL